MTSEKPTTSNPTCKRCGRFLRSATELALGYCSRCPLPAGEPPNKEEIFCCGSDPPCWTCPFVARPDE